MKIGAGAIVRQWGRRMSLTRGGVVLIAEFKGRRAELRPGSEELENSVDQLNFVIIADAEEFGAIRPQKFDVITKLDTLEKFTVQVGRATGADEDELIKMVVRGGIA
jgi:hypothetical protein